MQDFWQAWEPSEETTRQLRELGAPKRGAVGPYWADRRYIPADLDDQAELICELRRSTMDAVRSEAKAQDDLHAAHEQLTIKDGQIANMQIELENAKSSALGAFTVVLLVLAIGLWLNVAWAMSQPWPIGGGR